MKDYMAQVEELNNYMKMFPGYHDGMKLQDNELHHLHLCHPGTTRTKATIKQNFYWKNLQKDVEQMWHRCLICQKAKALTSKYGKLPPKI
jgi:hypothetical protein